MNLAGLLSRDFFIQAFEKVLEFTEARGFPRLQHPRPRTSRLYSHVQIPWYSDIPSLKDLAKIGSASPDDES